MPEKIPGNRVGTSCTGQLTARYPRLCRCAWPAAAYAQLHGAGNGVLTIAKGTLPLVLFGVRDYGARQGLLMVPARFAQATAPWLFGLAIDRFGAGALWFSAALGLVAFAALMLLQDSPS